MVASLFLINGGLNQWGSQERKIQTFKIVNGHCPWSSTSKSFMKICSKSFFAFREKGAFFATYFLESAIRTLSKPKKSINVLSMKFLLYTPLTRMAAFRDGKQCWTKGVSAENGDFSLLQNWYTLSISNLSCLIEVTNYRITTIIIIIGAMTINMTFSSPQKVGY